MDIRRAALDTRAMVYDRAAWHERAALDAGQPVENAFTHMGLYLAWAIRRGLHDGGVLPSDQADAVRSGRWVGLDLADTVDGTLAPDMLSAEGRAFSDARYSAYVEAYSAAFRDHAPYAVSDDSEAYARIAPVLDRLYDEWIRAGRPAPDAAPLEVVVGARPSDPLSAIDQVASMLGATIEEPAPSHVAPELERLVPVTLTEPPMRTESCTAGAWGSSTLRRALRELAVSTRVAKVVTAIGGRGPDTLSVFLVHVPGVGRERLEVGLRSAITRPSRTKWAERVVASRTVRWAEGPEFTVAYWAVDELAVSVAGRAALVERACVHLPR